MKVVLRDDVTNVGQKGDVKTVADGYARNYLIPRGLALKANKGVEAQAVAMRKAREAKDAETKEQAIALKSQLEGTAIQVAAKVGKDEKLFGSVTAADVVVAISKQTALAIDRHDIKIDSTIKTLGEHMIQVHLHPEVNADVKLEVVAS